MNMKRRRFTISTASTFQRVLSLRFSFMSVGIGSPENHRPPLLALAESLRNAIRGSCIWLEFPYIRIAYPNYPVKYIVHSSVTRLQKDGAGLALVAYGRTGPNMPMAIKGRSRFDTECLFCVHSRFPHGVRMW